MWLEAADLPYIPVSDLTRCWAQSIDSCSGPLNTPTSVNSSPLNHPPRPMSKLGLLGQSYSPIVTTTSKLSAGFHHRGTKHWTWSWVSAIDCIASHCRLHSSRRPSARYKFGSPRRSLGKHHHRTQTPIATAGDGAASRALLPRPGRTIARSTSTAMSVRPQSSRKVFLPIFDSTTAATSSAPVATTASKMSPPQSPLAERRDSVVSTTSTASASSPVLTPARADARKPSVDLLPIFE